MKNYDLIVLGGGLSGVAAAVSAAREGLHVLLAEQQGCLGGAMSNCLVYPFMAYQTTLPDGSHKILSAGLFAEMCERQRRWAPMGHGDFKPEYFKFVLDDMVTEAGVDVLFHATLSRVQTAGRQVTALVLATKAGELTVKADLFIDATGDGDLFAFAGCDFQLGRTADTLCQPMTTCFRVGNVDEDLLRKENAAMQALYKQFCTEGKITNPREDILHFRGLGRGIVHFNTTRIVKHDPTDPMALSRAEITARRQIREMMTFLQENVRAFRESTLLFSAVSIGVRESRKLIGEHLLTADELIACTRFSDAIALGNYDIDIHNPEGSGTSHRFFAPGEYYTIPYRSLLPREYDNLLVAGRCISATHEAQASIRIMPICATTGEAAGTAAAVAHRTGKNAHTVDVAALQALLRKNGAVID